MTVYRKRRGAATERIVADYLAANGFSYAQPAGAGRCGTDITGTPGLVWEVKARRALSLAADLRQAAGHGEGLPILVVRLDGTGPATVGEWPAVMRLGDLVRLLRMAGFGNPPGLDLPPVLDLAGVTCPCGHPAAGHVDAPWPDSSCYLVDPDCDCGLFGADFAPDVDPYEEDLS